MKKLIIAVLSTLVQKFEKISITSRLDRLKSNGAVIGKDVFFEGEVSDYKDSPLLTIEDGATVSKGTMIILHDSALNNILGSPIKFGKVNIGEESYIGANCTILCGVRIGKRAIVGAHSLVTSDIGDEAVAVGVPARVIGTIHESAEKHMRMAQSPSDTVSYLDVIPYRQRSHSEFLSTHREFVARITGGPSNGSAKAHLQNQDKSVS